MFTLILVEMCSISERKVEQAFLTHKGPRDEKLVTFACNPLVNEKSNKPF